jgi:cell division protein FtsB
MSERRPDYFSLKRPASKKRGDISGIQIMFAAILSIGLILVLNFSGRIAATQPMQQEYNRALAEIEQLERERAQLSALRDYVRSDAYVEQWARGEGKMTRGGEVLIVPVPVSDAGAPSPTPSVMLADLQTTPPEPETWQVWWSLFFDSPPPSPTE